MLNIINIKVVEKHKDISGRTFLPSDIDMVVTVGKFGCKKTQEVEFQYDYSQRAILGGQAIHYEIMGDYIDLQTLMDHLPKVIKDKEAELKRRIYTAIEGMPTEILPGESYEEGCAEQKILF